MFHAALQAFALAIIFVGFVGFPVALILHTVQDQREHRRRTAWRRPR